MNYTAGDSAKKVHLFNGSRTACNIRLSGYAEEMNAFKFAAEKHPEMCCKKCLNRYNELVNNKKSK